MNARLVVLREYEAARARPFAWGSEDCLTWCARCAEALTGRNPAEDLAGRYDSEEGAKAVMAEHGWRTLGGVAWSMFERIPVAQARSGDWALIVNADGTQTLGVVCGHLVIARTEKDGLAVVPMGLARRAYRVA